MTMAQTTKPVDASDSELVTASLVGNRDAFGLIVARYQSLLCALAYSATGSLSQSEDLAQETFVAAWKELASLREPAKLRSWLCRIARNLAHDALRREGREPAHEAEPLDEIQESPCADPLPSDRAISREEEAILWRSIERLPEIYREPLVLYYREHQSVLNVAAALNVSEDTVKQRLSRGRRLLEQQVMAFVEAALGRTGPGKPFTSAVLAALPASSASAQAAVAGVAALKGGTTAKAAAIGGVLGAMLAPPLGFLGNYIGYRIGLDGAKSDRERAHFQSFHRKLGAGLLGFFIVYGLLLILAEQFILDHHMVLASWIVGLVLPFALMLLANGIYWLRAPARFRAEIEVGGVALSPGRPVWEHRSKFILLGQPLVHIRVGGGLTAAATPAKAWIAAGDLAVGRLFAMGGVAIAPVSIGGLAVGLLSFGGGAVGMITLGGLSFGGWAFGALAFGWQAFGGCAIAWNAANGGVAVAHDFALGGVARALQVNNWAARSQMRASLFFYYAPQALRHLAWLNLLWVIPMLVRWRIIARSRRKESRSNS